MYKRQITSYKPDLAPLNYADTKPTEIYGSNVFSDKVMKERLPRIVYKSLRKTIEQGVQLDLSLIHIFGKAAAVAAAVVAFHAAQEAFVERAKRGAQFLEYPSGEFRMVFFVFADAVEDRRLDVGRDQPVKIRCV